ncbi:MAG TPA: extensin family protein [Kofleriaceae bacterium]|nr:extensin family protein [Kofleriaceae bacterium]
MRLLLLAALLVTAAPVPAARAEPEPASGAACLRALDALGVGYKKVRRRGIEVAVEVRGRLGGVEYRSYGGAPALVIDCSLAYSLARAGELLRAHGIDRVSYSSAYQRRNIRGTSRPSRHSYGLAIDVHSFVLAGGEKVAAVKLDYEQGLGDDADCMGDPLTELGAVLRAVDCQVSRSGLFRIVLTPDYDGDHYNHFHLEALPWRERGDRDPSARLDAAWSALERARPAAGI